MFEYFADARERFLKPTGVTIPATITLHTAAVESEDESRRMTFWENPRAGFSMSPAARIARNTGYPAKFTARDLLSDEAALCTLDASARITAAIKAEAHLLVTRRGTLHGMGGWFTATLASDVSMSNGPLADPRIDRSNVFFPLERAVDVQTGDSVRVAFRILPADLIVSWTVEVRRGGCDTARLLARSSHSTLDGMLLPREELARTSLAFVPKRSPRADARLSVLELCDGIRPLADIEREVFQRHRSLFRSADEAAVFVAEVVTRYSAS